MSYIGANSQGTIGVHTTDIIDSSTIRVAGHTIAEHDIVNDKVDIKNATLASSVTFPAGHIIQSKSTYTNNFSGFTTSTPTLISGFSQQIDVTISNSKMLVFLFLSGAGKGGSNTSLLVNLTESTTSLSETLTEISGFTADSYNGFDQTTLFFEHSHNQLSGTSLTYTPKFSSANNSSIAFINNYDSADGKAYSYILVQELVV